ncbi:uncharacterized protein LOC126842324 [Adelges cooleyi]|uniref:uncharacterized protein LOC126842324 n=1 Tax=Adelges cooleyi TaxID=133065 RepID=UPI0021802D76|nr:uncharacterized protein LOC126842324 [Adelges cooleyi]
MGVYEEAKARITSLQCRVQRVYEAGEALGNDSSNKLAKTKFKIMFATIENLYSDFETQLMVIIRHQCKSTPVVDAIDTDSVRALFEEKYIGCKIFADEYLPEAVVDDSLNKTFFESKALSASQPYHPIEKLAVPKFGGNPMEYTSFRNMFDKLVGESNMSPVVKFGYLKSYLVGEPLSLVSNLMLTDSNYELALAQLTDRYSNRRVIADSHIEALFNAPRATFGDGSSIRKLLNVILESTGALQNLSYAVDQWDPILLHLLQKKLDNYLRAQWELLVDTSEDPSMKEFTTFLTKYCKSATVSQGSVKVTTKGLKPNKSITLFSSQPERKLEQGRKNKSFSCPVCNTQPGHLLINCQSFKDKTPTERHQTIKELKRCFICFSAHMASECKNQRNCSTCGGKHHTLLHLEKTEPNVTTTHLTVAAAETKGYHTSVLLATASVVLQNKNGQSVTVRALLDSASQSSFVTERCVQLLGLKREKCDVTVQALSGAEVPAVRGRANVEVRPVDQQSPMFSIDVLILTRITGPVPSKRVWNHSWPHIKGLKLADPSFAEALPVDVLLGADVFPQLLLGDKEEGEVDEPIALSTVFGWVLMGKTTNGPKQQIITLCSSESVNHTLQQFFEIEEVPKVEKNNPADLECEQIYQTTTTRQQDGRYIVHLPFTRNPPLLGKSRDVALHRLRSLENKFKKSPELHKEYNMAMYDYLETGHMSAVVKKSDGEENMYYIPHQAVLRPESTTTKLRVVFDASAKTSSGHSLNDNLYCGQRLQQDLPGIVLRFRLHSVVFTADVKQMFRQIVVTEAHRPYQRLLYRFSLDEPVQEYQMNTVTFGQKSSPFLAIRTLHQLATDEAVNEPLVQTVVKRDLYVDDIATGAESEEAAIDLQKKLENTFAKGHFELRKWSSNSDKLLSNIPLDHQQTLPVTFEEHELTYTKVLGLNWDPKVDSLSYKYQPNPVKYSKRAILSEIARIYDPLGLLAPVTTVLKRLIKYLWVLKVDWDDIIPEDAKYAWQQYHQELPILATLRVPRLVTSPNALYELHGFSDSSEAAYAAIVYLRVCTSNRIGCHLLMGKAKISPTTKMSIPRLELCGAWLLAHLLDYVSKNLKSLSIGTVTAWTDSTVALAWIKSPTSRLKTFVANRVAQIQLLTKGYTWRHVPTEENPADCASRGLSPQQLTNHDLWWKGPTFLCQPKNTWPAQNADSPDSRLEEEAEEKPITLISQVKEEESRLLYQSDNLQKILRLTAYWLRVGDHLLGKPSACIFPPTVAETERSLRSLTRWTQRVFFADIKKAIATDKQVPASVHTSAQNTTDGSLKNFLQLMRPSDQKRQQRKRTKLNVEPGMSVETITSKNEDNPELVKEVEDVEDKEESFSDTNSSLYEVHLVEKPPFVSMRPSPTFVDTANVVIYKEAGDAVDNIDDKGDVVIFVEAVEAGTDTAAVTGNDATVVPRQALSARPLLSAAKTCDFDADDSNYVTVMPDGCQAGHFNSSTFTPINITEQEPKNLPIITVHPKLDADSRPRQPGNQLTNNQPSASKPRFIVGSHKNSSSKLSSVPVRKHADIFVSRLDPCVTSTMLESELFNSYSEVTINKMVITKIVGA